LIAAADDYLLSKESAQLMEAVMPDEQTLKPGWLRDDVRRAQERVREWSPSEAASRTGTANGGESCSTTTAERKKADNA
jgi:hypothetical protein